MEEDKVIEIEGTCQFFIDSTVNYFSNTTKTTPQTKVPYLKKAGNLDLKGYTGMIGISGNHRGYVYISGDEGMFKEVWKIVTGTEGSSEEILDMAGEVSNVIAGNVREQLGKDFMISVPMVFKGSPDTLRLPEDIPSYVIPFEWKSYSAFVVVGVLEN